MRGSQLTNRENQGKGHERKMREEGKVGKEKRSKRNELNKSSFLIFTYTNFSLVPSFHVTHPKIGGKHEWDTVTCLLASLLLIKGGINRAHL